MVVHLQELVLAVADVKVAHGGDTKRVQVRIVVRLEVLYDDLLLLLEVAFLIVDLIEHLLVAERLHVVLLLGLEVAGLLHDNGGDEIGLDLVNLLVVALQGKGLRQGSV